MSDQPWPPDATQEFWTANEAPFSGDTTAPQVLRLARPYLRPPVLDIGSGSGALLDLIPDAKGVDLVPRHPRVVQGSVTSLPFPDGCFGTAFATDLLEHLSGEMVQVGLGEIHRVLCPGGTFVATAPNREDMRANTVYCPCCQNRFHRWGHTWSISPEALRSALETRFHVLQLETLPLGLMAEHRLIRAHWRWFVRAGFCQPSDIFVVARRL